MNETREMETTRRRFFAVAASGSIIAGAAMCINRGSHTKRSRQTGLNAAMEPESHAAEASPKGAAPLSPILEIAILDKDIERFLAGKSLERQGHVKWLLSGGLIRVNRADCKNGRAVGKVIAVTRGACVIHSLDGAWHATLTDSETPSESNRLRLPESLNLSGGVTLAQALENQPRSLSNVSVGEVPFAAILSIPVLNDRGPYRVKGTVSATHNVDASLLSVVAEWLIDTVEFKFDPRLLTSPTPDSTLILDISLPSHLDVAV